MITIEIEKEIVKVRKGISSKSGKPFEMREQACVVHGCGRFPIETTLTLPDGVDGYSVGRYELLSPFSVGRYGLEVARDLGLVPAARPAAVKSA